MIQLNEVLPHVSTMILELSLTWYWSKEIHVVGSRTWKVSNFTLEEEMIDMSNVC